MPDSNSTTAENRRTRGFVTQISEWGALLHPIKCDLCDTDGERATQLQHAVHHVHGDGDFGGATIIFAKAQSITDDLLIPSDVGFNTAALVVS